MSLPQATDSSALAGGSYARKQLLCKDRLIAWSHRSRFRTARRLVEPLAGQPLLDYGCGDGTFLLLVHDLFPRATGADINPPQTADCARRLAYLPGLEFLLTQDLCRPRHAAAYQIITCMEVLEHCTDEGVGHVLEQLKGLAAPGGRIVISVPIEIGPTLPLKQAARTVAGWRNLGDYKRNERYTWGELARMTFATARTTIPRPLYVSQWSPGYRTEGHGHKGFNWRRLRARVGRALTIERTLFSPLNWTRGFFSSQAWFVCRR
jgi:SAM-dependent methyltransferase